jgi:hypothetical protein
MLVILGSILATARSSSASREPALPEAPVSAQAH